MVYTNNPYSYNYGYYPAVQAQYAQPMIYPQQQVVEQPQNLNVQSGQTTNAMDSYMIWVQGEAGAKSYPVARGTTLPLFDTEEDFVYFKTVDNNGIPLPLVKKALSDPLPVVKDEKVVETPQVDLSNYVTKERYEKLEERVLELETKPTFSTTFSDNTFNNTRKGTTTDGSKFNL